MWNICCHNIKYSCLYGDEKMFYFKCKKIYILINNFNISSVNQRVLIRFPHNFCSPHHFFLTPPTFPLSFAPPPILPFTFLLPPPTTFPKLVYPPPPPQSGNAEFSVPPLSHYSPIYQRKVLNRSSLQSYKKLFMFYKSFFLFT